MQVQVQLVHAESGRRVVLASALRNGTCMATALGEGSTAEEAEDRARRRLSTELQTVAPAPSKTATAVPLESPVQRKPSRAAGPPPRQGTAIAPPAEPAEPAAVPADEPAGSGSPTSEAQRHDAREEADQEPAPDPEDWSSELAQLELQLKRLGWGREQEAVFLQRAFGHGSRSRLTRYNDLMAYLRTLEDLGSSADPASCAIPLRRSDLLVQSDQLLSQLQWDANQGRRLLESRFGLSSRQQLSDPQLLEFNMVLEGEWLSRGSISSAG